MLLKMYNYILLLCCLTTSSLSALTLEEKVGQLLIVCFEGREVTTGARRLIEEAHVGGFIYYNDINDLDSPAQVKALSVGLQRLTKTPLWICVDQEGGPVCRLKNGFYDMPGNRAVAQSGQPKCAERAAYTMGLEMRSVGINMNLAPVVDVSSDPVSSYMSRRTFGDTPDVVTAFAKRALVGYKRAKIVAVIKHFPGYGNVRIDPHADLPVLQRSQEEWEQIDLAPFASLASQTPAMMTAHIMVPAVDPVHCATLSRPIIEGVLRRKIGFDGLVISDSMVMQGLLKNGYSIEEASILAINAGNDLLIFGGTRLFLIDKKNHALTSDALIGVHKALVDAVKTGRISEERLNEAVERSLKLKREYLE